MIEDSILAAPIEAGMDVFRDDADPPGTVFDAGHELREVDAEPDPSSMDTSTADLAGDMEDARTPDNNDAASDGGQVVKGDGSVVGIVDASQQAGSCTAATSARWFDYHLSARFAPEMAACMAPPPGCDGGACAAEQCLARQLGIDGCNHCIAQEVACLMETCAESCLVQADEMCRACACRNGCISGLQTCTGKSGNLCGDCGDLTCVNQSMPLSEEIMAVVNHVLFTIP